MHLGSHKIFYLLRSMNRSEESNRARSLSALVEELKDEEDEDLLVLKKFPSEEKQHSRYQKKYIKKSFC